MKCYGSLNVYTFFWLTRYIYHFSAVVDFSSERYSGSTGYMNSWYQQRNLQWGCWWWDSNSQPLDYKPSALAIELTSSISYCWERIEFIQLVYCIIIYLSFLSCGWLLIWYIQWFYWTHEFLVTIERFTVSMPMVRLELAAIELNSSKAIAGKELSLSSWCVASLYIYHFSTVVDFSSEQYSGQTQLLPSNSFWAI